MELNPVDWLKAQELLLKLVSALAPLADSSLATLVHPFNRRLFVPSQPSQFGQPQPFPHSVSLLTKMREEVSEWIEKLPEAKTENPVFPEVKRPQQKIETNPTKTEEPFAPRTQKPLLASLTKWGEEKGRVPLNPASFETKTVQKVPVEAQKLLLQVRTAIQTLSSSTNLSLPKADPLRDALVRLKPMIDAFVETISNAEETIPKDPAPQFRHAVPKSPREYLFKKEALLSKPPLAPQPESPIKNEAIPFSKPLRQQTVEKEEQPKAEQRILQEVRSNSRKETRKQPASFESAPLTPATKPPQNPPEKISSSITPLPEEAAEKPKPSFERTSIPSAPFLGSLRPTLQSQKKKKKRKSFWSFDEKEESEK